MLQSHYSSTLDFSNAALQAAEKGYARMMQAYETLQSLEASDSSDLDFEEFENKCYTAMNDDFNSPILIAHLFDAAKFINAVKAGNRKIDAADKEALTQLFKTFLFDVLGFRKVEEKGDKALMEYLMQTLIDIRNTAKKNKDYAQSDAIRDTLASHGIVLKDSREGTTWEMK